MSSDVRIDRIHHTLRSPGPIEADRLHAWQAVMADADLEPLGDGVADDEWVFIRRLQVHARWRPDRPGRDAAQAWSQAVQQATRECLATPGHPDVVRYRDRRHALADLIYRCALGDTRRQWAWQRMGWWQGDRTPAEGLRLGLAALVAQPGWIWPLLTHWLAAEPDTGVWTAVLHALTPAEALHLLARAPAARPYVEALGRQDTGLPLRPPAGNAPIPGPAGIEVDTDWPAAARRLIDWVQRRPGWAVSHADVLSVVLAALAWPDRTSGRHVVARRLQRAQAQVRAAAPARTPEPVRLRAPGPATRPPALSTETTTPSGLDEGRVPPRAEPACAPATDATPTAPELPDTAQAAHTDWAGALFWLRALQAPGVLDELLGPTAGDVQVDSADPLAHALLAVVRALGVPDSDPVGAAFCGGQCPSGVPRPGVVEAAHALVARWSAWLDEAWSEAPEPRLRRVCQRPGRLAIEPGWIELTLPLDQVDTGVRRLGLDLDPGYLPWLGCVVRIRYE